MKRVAVFVCIILILYNDSWVFATSGVSFTIEMLPWNEVNILLPKYSKFTVLDIETGKQFRVQRRAGSHHADVQPLTSKDTKIMKSIYGGEWSWKRRAIIIIHKNHWIAASMHGMPHGAGALPNNFPGHFCIHFYGSTTHRTNTMDLSHMFMVLKAAGKLTEFLGKANPYEVVSAYMIGLKQQDERIIFETSLQELEWKPIFPQIMNVEITRLPLLPAEDLTGEVSLDIPIEIDWSMKKYGRQTFKGDIHLIRFSQYDRWKVDSIHFLKENNIHFRKKHL